jgi:hypothetical protein
VPHSKRFMLSISAIIVLALPALAATPRRHASPPPYSVRITGVVTDATTNKPVAAAEVTVVNSNSKGVTDAEGKFTVNALGGYSIGLQAARTGYTAQTKTVDGATNTTVNFSLQPTATSSIREVSGTITQVDTESLKLAYLVPFSGYVSSNSGNFCLADGSVVKPNLSEISRLIGPATPVSVSKCCNFPIMTMQVVYKSGVTSTVYFADSCFGNEIDVLGREHATGQFVYFNLANVAEVTLP